MPDQLTLFPIPTEPHPDGYKTEKWEEVPLPAEVRTVYEVAMFYIKQVKTIYKINGPQGWLIDVLPHSDNADPAAALEIAAAGLHMTAYRARKPIGLTWTEFYQTIEIYPAPPQESEEATPPNMEIAPSETVNTVTAAPHTLQNKCTPEGGKMQPTITFRPDARRLAQDLRALADIIQEPHLYAHDAPHRVWVLETISFLVAVASTAASPELQEDAEVLLNLTTTDLVTVLDRPNPISAQIQTMIGEIKHSQNPPPYTPAAEQGEAD